MHMCLSFALPLSFVNSLHLIIEVKLQLLYFSEKFQYLLVEVGTPTYLLKLYFSSRTLTRVICSWMSWGFKNVSYSSQKPSHNTCSWIFHSAGVIARQPSDTLCRPRRSLDSSAPNHRWTHSWANNPFLAITEPSFTGTPFNWCEATSWILSPLSCSCWAGQVSEKHSSTSNLLSQHFNIEYDVGTAKRSCRRAFFTHGGILVI